MNRMVGKYPHSLNKALGVCREGEKIIQHTFFNFSDIGPMIMEWMILMRKIIYIHIFGHNII